MWPLSSSWWVTEAWVFLARVRGPPVSLCLRVAFLPACVFPPLFVRTQVFHGGFRGCHLDILNSIPSAKTLFLNQITFAGPRA